MNHDTQSNLPTSGPTGLAAGSVLGAYTLTEPLGRGGMGQVWKATDGKRPVAIKLLPTEFRGNAAAMAQVEEAFQIVHALTHEHICKTLGLFDDRVHGPYLVLDFIPGITLSEYQRTGGFPKKQLPVELVAEILRPVARALDYSHRKVIQLPSGDEHMGVLHRDVKPDNILIVQREGRIHEVWLIDFGLAAEIRNTMTKHTNSSVDTRGTRPYMSPEQIKGKRHQWDARTDQYSLAVVAYQLLSGHLPFDGDDEFSLMLAITQEAADPIPGLREAVNAAVLKGLAKTKEERFGSCLEFVDAVAAESKSPVIVPEPESSATETFRNKSVPINSLPSWNDPEPQIEVLPDSPKLGDTKEITLPGGVKHKLIWCPPGAFTMGSPATEKDRKDNENQVEVVLTNGFWLGQTVVTQAMWTAVMETAPWSKQPYCETGLDYPAVNVSHANATAFCDELTKIEQAAGSIPTDWKYALPTEAQWEYACRAGTKTTYSFGNKVLQLGDYAWFSRNTSNEKFAHTVGAKNANPWGLHDMHGNVWEWCEDWYDEDMVGGMNPRGPASGSFRVLRGGSWFEWDVGKYRSAYRNRSIPSGQRIDVGFRLCLCKE